MVRKNLWRINKINKVLVDVSYIKQFMGLFSNMHFVFVDGKEGDSTYKNVIQKPK